MRKTVLTSVLAVLAVICLCFAVCFAPVTAEKVTVTDFDMPAAAADVTASVADEDVSVAAIGDTAPELVSAQYDEEYLIKRFGSMLALNYCYGDAFYDEERLVSAAAVTLSDYATDLPGVGLAVNSALVEGFVQSFYGIQLDEKEQRFGGAPEGYVSAPVGSVATQLHSVQSVNETEEGYEVYSLVEFYYGGDEIEFSVARSVFVADSDSEFGFNLVLCELM